MDMPKILHIWTEKEQRESILEAQTYFQAPGLFLSHTHKKSASVSCI